MLDVHKRSDFEKASDAVIYCIVMIPLLVVLGLGIGTFLGVGKLDSTLYADTRGACLECGYPDSTVHDDIGYCIRLENGTEIVVPVDKACKE